MTNTKSKTEKGEMLPEDIAHTYFSMRKFFFFRTEYSLINGNVDLVQKSNEMLIPMLT